MDLNSTFASGNVKSIHLEKSLSPGDVGFPGRDVAGTAHLAHPLAARWAEMQLRLQEVLNAMEPMDREVLALSRHFEELSNGEVAHVLGLSKNAASNRYMRALVRLKEMLRGEPGFLDD